jgi:DNA-binding PadR family transcriptional regulator
MEEVIMLKYALLGFLNYRPMTGYELKQNMDVSTVHFWNAKLSQIYTVLKSLEQEGWIVSKVKPQEERPDKRIYTLTPEGKRNLQAWLAEPQTEQAQQKHGLLLKLFFSAQIDRENVIAQLHFQRSLHERQADFYRTKSRAVIQEILKQSPALEQEETFWEATRRFGELYEEMYVKWLNETIRSLESD